MAKQTGWTKPATVLCFFLTVVAVIGQILGVARGRDLNVSALTLAAVFLVLGVISGFMKPRGASTASAPETEDTGKSE